MEARIIETTEYKTTLEWDGPYGGIGTDVVADGKTYTITNITCRGPYGNGGAFVTIGTAWTAKYYEEEAKREEEAELFGRRAATTDKY